MTTESVIKIMKKAMLFKNMEESQLNEILEHDDTRIKTYKKDSFIFEENETPERLFILLSGNVGITKITSAGKRILIHKIEKPGGIFGEVYLFMENHNYEFSAEAMSDTVILEMKNEIFFETHNGEMNKIDMKLRNNMLKIFAQKAFQLNRKVRILGRSSIREKITVYLLNRQKNNESEITLPGREEMADYLNVTRPSLSRELINMSNEKIIRVDGRKITILNQQLLEEYL